VPGSHVLVEALDSVGTRELTEFLVHVMCTGTRVVTDPDAKVLDLYGPPFVDLHQKAKRNAKCQRMYRQSRPSATWTAAWETYGGDANDLTIGLFNLLQLSVGVSTLVQTVYLGDKRTSGSTRNGIWQRPHLARRCACGRSWGWDPPRWVSDGRRLGTLRWPSALSVRTSRSQNNEKCERLAAIVLRMVGY